MREVYVESRVVLRETLQVRDHGSLDQSDGSGYGETQLVLNTF